MSIEKYQTSVVGKTPDAKQFKSDSILSKLLGEKESVDIENTLRTIAQNKPKQDRQGVYQKLLSDIDKLNREIQENILPQKVAEPNTQLENIKEDIYSPVSSTQNYLSNLHGPSSRRRGGQVEAFDYLRSFSPTRLLSFLSQEKPPVLAVVATYLEPSQKKAFFRLITLELKQKIIEYLAQVSSVSASTLGELDKRLRKRFETEYSQKDLLIDGFDTLVKILTLMPKEKSFLLYQSLKGEFPVLEELLLEKFYSLDTFLTLPNQAAFAVLNTLAPFDIAILLKNQSPTWQNKILINLSQTRKEWIKAEQEEAPTPSLKDVRQVEQKLRYALKSLSDEGKISFDTLKKIPVSRSKVL